MKHLFQLLLISTSIVFFTSCEKKELPISLPAKGDGVSMQVDMGYNYEYQFYINLQQQKVVHTSLVDSWDIAFQSGANEQAVFLNGGKGMAAFNTHKIDFALVGMNDSINSQSAWGYDAPSGETDSTALHDWNKAKEIYIIRLDNTGKKLRKLQIISEDIFEYKIALGDINSSTPAYITIPKNGDQNFTYFSLDLLATVENVEPQKNTWDVLVTRYNYTFYDQTPALPYVVNGFLLNPTKTTGYKDSVTDYNAINADFANGVTLTSKRDVIGFDWKFYDRSSSSPSYTIIKKYNYLVKTQENHLFKLHFLDFYSSTGVKGSPKFELKQLN